VHTAAVVGAEEGMEREETGKMGESSVAGAHI
jgi:hypothetical protein